MLIRSSTAYRTLAHPKQPPAPLKSAPDAERLPPTPVLEQTAAGAILGASVGTLAGAQVGRYGALAGGALGGYHLGNSILPGWGGSVGAVLGLVGTHTAEQYLGLGETAGAAVGFLAGSVVGGAVGTAVGGFEHLLEWNRSRTE